MWTAPWGCCGDKRLWGRGRAHAWAWGGNKSTEEGLLPRDRLQVSFSITAARAPVYNIHRHKITHKRTSLAYFKRMLLTRRGVCALGEHQPWLFNPLLVQKSGWNTRFYRSLSFLAAESLNFKNLTSKLHLDLCSVIFHGLVSWIAVGSATFLTSHISSNISEQYGSHIKWVTSDTRCSPDRIHWILVRGAPKAPQRTYWGWNTAWPFVARETPIIYAKFPHENVFVDQAISKQCLVVISTAADTWSLQSVKYEAVKWKCDLCSVP